MGRIRTEVCATNLEEMLVKNWDYNSASYPYDPPYSFRFLLGSPYDMVPPPGGLGTTAYGDLVNKPGKEGQRSPTPSQKFFTRHFIVHATLPSIGGPYFDPSYGVTYANEAAVQAVLAGFARRNPRLVQENYMDYVVRMPEELNVSLAQSYPGAPVLLAPANGANEVPTQTALSWQPSSGNTAFYLVYISTNSDLSNPVAAAVFGSASITATLESATTYYWRVSAGVCQYQSHSPIWSFRTQ